MIGGIRRRLPTDMRPSCQITLKRKPEQRGLSQCVGLSLLQHVSPYVHRGRGTISYVFLCLYLSCCLHCALCSLSLSPSSSSLSSLCFAAASPLCSFRTLLFVLCIHNRVVISEEITSCSWQFQDDTLTLEILWLANIVWASLWVKLLRGSR